MKFDSENWVCDVGMKANGDDVFADSASLRRSELEPESSEKFSRSPQLSSPTQKHNENQYSNVLTQFGLKW